MDARGSGRGLLRSMAQTAHRPLVKASPGSPLEPGAYGARHGFAGFPEGNGRRGPTGESGKTEPGTARHRGSGRGLCPSQNRSSGCSSSQRSSSLSGVAGIRSTWIPVASSIAEAIAGAPPSIGSSPMPLAPNGPFG